MTAAELIALGLGCLCGLAGASLIFAFVIGSALLNARAEFGAEKPRKE